ncbi:hypothetical protein ABWH91_03860 [Phycisphaerales bacterium ac7]
MKPTAPWPPPGFPILSGERQLTRNWSVDLPLELAQRIEQGSMVLWRPRFTVWIDIWGNDQGESQSERLEWLKAETSAQAANASVHHSDGLTFYTYELTEGDQRPVHALYAFVLSDAGHVQAAIYCDDKSNLSDALVLARSFRWREMGMQAE